MSGTSQQAYVTTNQFHPKWFEKAYVIREKEVQKRCRSGDQKTVRGNILQLWREKMCFQPAAKGGNRGAGTKIRWQFVPHRRSSKCERASAY